MATGESSAGHDGKLAVFEIIAGSELKALDQSPFDFAGLQPELAFATTPKAL
jgi:hypothetical protein